MKQTKNSRLRQIASGLLAALMLMTSAPASYALEPVISIQQIVPEQGEETIEKEALELEQGPDHEDLDPTLEEKAEETDAGPILDEEPGDEDEEQGTNEQSTAPVEEQPQTSPAHENSEPVEPTKDALPTEEFTIDSLDMDYPESDSFEVLLETRRTKSRSANIRDSLYINMKTVPEYSFKYPFGIGTSTFAFYVYWTSDGQTAYCIEPARFDSNHGTPITGSLTWTGLSLEKQQAIARVIAANTEGHSDYASYAAAQVLIWEIAMGQSPKSGSVYQAVVVPHASELSGKYDAILQRYQTMGEIPSFMSGDRNNPTLYQMQENNGNFSIELENTNSAVTLYEEAFQSQAPLQFTVSEDTLIVSSEKPGTNSLVIWESMPGESGLVFWNSSEQTKASAAKTSGVPVNGYMLFSSDATLPIPPEDEEEVQKVGYLSIYKYDSTNNLPLGGALFSLECEGFRDDAFPVPYGGAVAAIPIPEGKDSVTVSITEVAAPEGYLLSEETKTVTVTANNLSNIAEIGFGNEPKSCSLEIYKHEKGNINIPLPGARFRIRYADPDVSAQVWTKTTNSSGRIHIDLPHSGTLIVEELEAPSGYVIGEISTHEVVVQKGEDKEISISNDKKAQIIVTKRDNQTGQPLQGAVIKATLLRSHTEPYESGLVYTRTTGLDGVAIFEDMIPGEWRVEESSPPQFYLPTDQVHTVNVYDGSHEPVELEFRNDPWTGLTVRKLDALDGHGLQGAVFELYEGTAAEKTKFLGDFQSNENGIVTIQELESNQYYTIVESQPPYGYFLDEDNTQTILIKPEAINENITVIFRNMPKPKLEIIKVNGDDESERLSGAVFRVAKRGSQEYMDVTTGPDGSVLLENLEEGWYTVFERQSPVGFSLDTRHYDIELEAGKTSQLIVQNYRKPSITIEKLCSLSLQPLEGCVFEISVKNGKSLGQFTTGPDGKIVLEDVEPDQIYLIKEVRSLPGYLLDETVYEIKPGTNESPGLRLTNTPEQPILIEKRDEFTGDPIPDTTFLVTKASGELVGEYTTGQNGIAVVTGEGVSPGWYQIREIKANPAYIQTDETKLVELKYGEPATALFHNRPRTGLQIQKKDSVTLEPLENVGFEIREVNGESLGTYYTDEAGIINLPDQEEKWVQIIEVAPQNGYKPDPEPRLVKLESGKLHIEEYRNQPYPILEITKVNEKGEPLEGVKIRISDYLHREIGTYTTNVAGKIVLTGMDGDQVLYVQETEALPGYELDTQGYEAAMSWGKTTPVRIVNRALGTFRLTKIDSETKKPIYGAVFNLYDSRNNLIGEYVTDQEGVIEFPRELEAGKYKVKEVKCDGYVVDPTIRTVELKAGETTELVLENQPIRGQIQIIKKAAGYNDITKDKEGALLEGATFEIFDHKNQVVDTITTDSRGVATSKPLPIGIYGCRETESPEHFLLDGSIFYAAIKVHGDLVRFEVLNKPERLEVDVTKFGNYEAMPGDTIRYDFENITNASSVELENFYWRDELPDSLRLKSIYTGTWSEHLTYDVEYRTNQRGWRTLEGHLSSRADHELDCSREALHLKEGEYVTAFRFNFGTVQAGFREVEAPHIYCTVQGGLPSGHRFVNRTDVGGQRHGEWVIDKDSWTTVVFSTQKQKFPKTGF